MTFETELRAALERATPGKYRMYRMTREVWAYSPGKGDKVWKARKDFEGDSDLAILLRNRALGIAELVEAARAAAWQAEAFSPERDKICIICPSKAVDENEEIEHQPGCAIAKIGAALAHLDTPTGGEEN